MATEEIREGGPGDVVQVLMLDYQFAAFKAHLAIVHNSEVIPVPVQPDEDGNAIPTYIISRRGGLPT